MPAAVRPGQRGVKVLRSGRSPRARRTGCSAPGPCHPRGLLRATPGLRAVSSPPAHTLQNTEEKQSRTERT